MLLSLPRLLPLLRTVVFSPPSRLGKSEKKEKGLATLVLPWAQGPKMGRYIGLLPEKEKCRFSPPRVKALSVVGLVALASLMLLPKRRHSACGNAVALSEVTDGLERLLRQFAGAEEVRRQTLAAVGRHVLTREPLRLLISGDERSATIAELIATSFFKPENTRIRRGPMLAATTLVLILGKRRHVALLFAATTALVFFPFATKEKIPYPLQCGVAWYRLNDEPLKDAYVAIVDARSSGKKNQSLFDDFAFPIVLLLSNEDQPQFQAVHIPPLRDHDIDDALALFLESDVAAGLRDALMFESIRWLGSIEVKDDLADFVRHKVTKDGLGAMKNIFRDSLDFEDASTLIRNHQGGLCNLLLGLSSSSSADDHHKNIEATIVPL